MATSRVLRVTITTKPCRIGASFKWLRLPRKNGQNVAPNEDLVVVCMVLLPAWPLCTPTRMMCPPLLFFPHLLWMVSTSMTKNLRMTYSLTWGSCRTWDVTFQSYVGRIPDTSYFMPDVVSVSARRDFVEKICYFDFMSLYPWVNKNGKYPLGHPEIISQPGHTDLSRYFGLVKCTVLPPHGLFHPVLPYRHAGKLTFPLCSSCVTEEMSKPFLERTPVCTHRFETPTCRDLVHTRTPQGY